MNRFALSKVIKFEVKNALRISKAKQRPNTLFEQVFYDIREKAKTFKKTLESQAVVNIESQLVKDLKGHGFSISNHKLSLGSYRGSSFITSFILEVKVKDEEQIKKLETYLQSKYSPKWKFKELIEENIAKFNIR
jgi:hypothetical protein